MCATYIRAVYDFFVINPLRKLYFFGPSVLHVGFWGGKTNSEICQSITTYSESFWEDNPFQCDQIVEKKFNSFCVTIETLVYFVVLYQIIANSSRFCFFEIFKCKKKRKLEDEKNIVLLTMPSNSIIK